MVTWLPWLPGPECLGEETVPFFSYPRPLSSLDPMATIHPLDSRMALKTQSSSVSVVPDKGKWETISLEEGV